MDFTGDYLEVLFKLYRARFVRQKDLSDLERIALDYWGKKKIVLSKTVRNPDIPQDTELIYQLTEKGKEYYKEIVRYAFRKLR